MAESEKFSNWVDAGALFSFERQLHIADVVEGHDRWDVDLAQQQLIFRFPDRDLVCAAQLLGSSAPGPNSWLWAWANTQITPAATEFAGKLREFGETEGIPELTTAEVPLGEAGNEPPEAFWYRLVTAVTGIAEGFDGYFRAPLGGGTIAPLFIAHEELALPAPEATRVLRVLTEGFAAIRIGDERVAVQSYAQRRGIQLDWVDGAQATLTLPEGALTVAFDPETLRLAQVSGSLGGS